MLLALTLLTGILYPLIMTGICRVAFPDKSDGSILRATNGTAVGSRLLAQEFDSVIYFHPRLSAVGTMTDGGRFQSPRFFRREQLGDHRRYAA